MAQILENPIVAAVILLGLLVFIHELGHFLVGLLCGAGVETFSLGFGPKLISLRFGGTEYLLSAVPLGGYVKFAGSTEYDEAPPQHKGKEYFRLAKWKRALIIAAGPLANLILAVCVYTYLGSVGRPHNPAIIGLVREGSPAAASGLQSGDQVLAVNGSEVKTFDEIREAISDSPRKALLIKVMRDEKVAEFNVVPEVTNEEDREGNIGDQGRIGIGLGFREPIVSVGESSSLAAKSGFRTGDLVQKIVDAGGKEHAIHDFDHLQRTLSLLQTAPKPLKFMIKRGERSESVELPAEVNASPAFFRSAELSVKAVTRPEHQGLKPGDELLKMNGQELKDIFSLSSELAKLTEAQASFTVRRADAVVEVPVELIPYEVQKPSGKVVHYRVDLDFSANLAAPEPYMERYDTLPAAIGYGVRTTYEQSFVLAGAVIGLITGQIPLKVLGGPVMIAKFAGDAAKQGIGVFLSMMALISVNLAVVNLLPIPVLDGGQLVLLGFEALKGRRLERRAIENFQKVGFVLVLFLMVIATYNDFSRFWTSMLRGLKGIF